MLPQDEASFPARSQQLPTSLRPTCSCGGVRETCGSPPPSLSEPRQSMVFQTEMFA